jgi:hypothetical protein
MNKKTDFPSRKQLDEAFHFLHDQINRIAIMEEIEMMKQENEENDTIR